MYNKFMNFVFFLAFLIFMLGNSSCEKAEVIEDKWPTILEIQIEAYIDSESLQIEHVSYCSYYEKPDRDINKLYKNLKLGWYDKNGNRLLEAYFYLKDNIKVESKLKVIGYLDYYFSENEEEVIRIFRSDNRIHKEEPILEIKKSDLPKSPFNCEKQAFDFPPKEPAN